MTRWFLPLLAGLLLAGCASKPRVPPESIVRVRFMLEAADNRSLSLELPRSGVRIAVNPQPVVTEFDVIEAAVAKVELGRCLMFRLTPSATRDLYRLTGTNQGRRLVLTVDGNPLGARRIEAPIADGTIFVFAELPDEALAKLVEDVRASSAELQREIARKS